MAPSYSTHGPSLLPTGLAGNPDAREDRLRHSGHCQALHSHITLTLRHSTRSPNVQLRPHGTSSHSHQCGQVCDGGAAYQGSWFLPHHRAYCSLWPSLGCPPCLPCAAQGSPSACGRPNVFTPRPLSPRAPSVLSPLACAEPLLRASFEWGLGTQVLPGVGEPGGLAVLVQHGQAGDRQTQRAWEEEAPPHAPGAGSCR